MKIDKPLDIAAVSTTPAAAQSAASQGGGRPSSASAAAGRGRATESNPGVTVSVRARSLVSLSAAGGDIDMNKVEAVRTAIEQGTFSINAEVIADRLLANARDMLGRSRA